MAKEPKVKKKLGRPPGKKHPKGHNAGRPKGTRNKNTYLLIKGLDREGFELIPELIKSIDMILDPKDRADILLKLCEFAYPKLKALPQAPTENVIDVSPQKQLSNISTEDLMRALNDEDQ